MNSKNREHITLSGAILEDLAKKFIEEKFGKTWAETEWIMDDDYGFAGFRIYFHSDDSKEEIK